jgi:hypothetical protein
MTSSVKNAMLEGQTVKTGASIFARGSPMKQVDMKKNTHGSSEWR